MTKAELIEKLADRTGLAKARAEAALDAIIVLLGESLGKGESVSFQGFGTFKLASRPGRKGRNPRTGAPLEIPAANVAKFTPAKALKDAINS